MAGSLATALAGLGLLAGVCLVSPAAAENNRDRTIEKPRQDKVQPAAGEEILPADAGPAAVDIAPITPGDSLARSVEGGELQSLPLLPEPEPDPAAASGVPQWPAAPAPALDGEPQGGGALALPAAPSSLPPLASTDALPRGLWGALGRREAEQHFARLSVPPASPTLHRLWRALLLDEPAGTDGETLLALRIEGLSRSGLLGDAAALAGRLGDGGSDPVVVSALIRTHLALGAKAEACAGVKQLPLKDAKLPKRLRAEGLATAAYCAASSKDPEAAKLGAKVLSGAGVDAPVGRAVLEALASGAQVRLPSEGRVRLVDEALLRLVAPLDAPQIYARAEADAAAAAAGDDAADPLARAYAGEAAARANALSSASLARLYQAVEIPAEERQNPLASSLEGARKRALLYQAALAERSPLRKARNARAFLDEARRDGAYLASAEMLADAIADLPLSPEIGWFAETAIEVNLAAGRYRPAAAWADFGSTLAGGRPEGLLHWLVLVDIADAGGGFRHGSSLRHVEAFALAGGLSPELLQRLATVLDALQYDIPIPLWEAASREGQSEKGHLPETGVLSELQQAAAGGERGRTILLSLRAIGPGRAADAHLLSLGDVIRSLKAAGFEAEARRLGFEALFEDWPRRASG
jgi:hypothetical protein